MGFEDEVELARFASVGFSHVVSPPWRVCFISCKPFRHCFFTRFRAASR